MKRLFALILTLAMVCSLSLSVSAAKVGVGSSDVGEVKIIVVDGGVSTSPEYYVVVEWTSLTFTYTEGDVEKDWIPEEHAYTTTQSEGSWDKTSANITVTNHSNTAVGVVMNFAGGRTTKTVNNVTATLSNHTFDLATAEDIPNFDDADKKVATVSIENEPSSGTDFSVGMIQIAITDK